MSHEVLFTIFDCVTKSEQRSWCLVVALAVAEYDGVGRRKLE